MNRPIAAIQLPATRIATRVHGTRTCATWPARSDQGPLFGLVLEDVHVADLAGLFAPLAA
jgi:hypothetical protein